MSPPRVLVMRAAEDADDLATALRDRGLEPVQLPLLEFGPGPDAAVVRGDLASLPAGSWVVLTSPRAVPSMAAVLPLPGGISVAAVGPRTAAALGDAGIVPAVVGSGGAAELGSALVAARAPRVLWLAGNRALPLLSDGLAAAGIPLTTRVVYTTTVRRPFADETASAFRDLAAACFSSPSTVVGLCACAPPRWLSDARKNLIAVAPGHSTAAALREAGFLRIRLSHSPAASHLADAARQGIQGSSPRAMPPRQRIDSRPEDTEMQDRFMRSRALMERARQVIPGGVNSPVRAYKSVGGTPPFLTRGEGCRVWDEDGHDYIDLVMSYGPLILGHAHPAVTRAVADALSRGTSFGAPTEGEVLLAEVITRRIPSMDMVRLVNSGTEATMSALRLARAATGRTSMVKFNGCYHGHGDAFLVKAGSGALTLGAPDSPGVPAEVAGTTLICEYNDLASVERTFEQHGASIAAVFVEPVAGNMGCVLPEAGFLEGLGSLCTAFGALLVFDEVMTGFRVGPGGYQNTCGVVPDLTTLGKVIGGGLPVGAYGGRRDLMEMISPAGPVYQAGTLSGNPLAVAAGLAALEELDQASVWDTLEDAGAHLQAGLEHILQDLRIPGRVNRQGSMLCLYFSDRPVRTFQDVLATDRERFVGFFHRLLELGILLPPSPFEAWFLSTAHDVPALDTVLDAMRSALTPS